MKTLKQLSTILIIFQFIFYPIAYAQPGRVSSPEEIFSADDFILKLKKIFRSEKYKGYIFLDKNKNDISLDNLIKSDDSEFYVLPADLQKITFKVKLNELNNNKSFTISLGAYDRNTSQYLDGRNIAIYFNKDSSTNLQSVKEQISRLSDSLNRKINIQKNTSSNATLQTTLKSISIIAFAVAFVLYSVAIWALSRDVVALSHMGGSVYLSSRATIRRKTAIELLKNKRVLVMLIVPLGVSLLSYIGYKYISSSSQRG